MNGLDLSGKMKFENPDHMSAKALAYIGDAVYELYIRSILVSKGLRNPKQLHSAKVTYAKAAGQRAAYDRIISILNEDEKRVASRGRNAKTGSLPKNARLSDYSYATAFEAVLGYLYIKNDEKRLKEILEAAVGNEDE